MNARDDEAKEGSLGTGKYIFEAATVLFVTVTDIGFIVTCSYLILTSVKAATCSVRVHRELGRPARPLLLPNVPQRHAVPGELPLPAAVPAAGARAACRVSAE